MHYIRQLRRPKPDKLFSIFEYFFDAAGDFDRFLLGYPTGIHAEPLFPVVPCDTDVVIRFIFRMLGLNHDSGLPVDVHIRDDRAFNSVNLCRILSHFAVRPIRKCTRCMDIQEYNSSTSPQGPPAGTTGSTRPASPPARRTRRPRLPPDSSA